LLSVVLLSSLTLCVLQQIFRIIFIVMGHAQWVMGRCFNGLLGHGRCQWPTACYDTLAVIWDIMPPREGKGYPHFLTCAFPGSGPENKRSLNSQTTVPSLLIFTQQELIIKLIISFINFTF